MDELLIPGSGLVVADEPVLIAGAGLVQIEVEEPPPEPELTPIVMTWTL
jgi:hypothetical protein